MRVWKVYVTGDANNNGQTTMATSQSEYFVFALTITATMNKFILLLASSCP